MEALELLYAFGLVIGPLMFCAGVCGLIFSILNVMKVVRNARLFRVPLVERQTITFNEAGRVMLNGEGPLFTSRFVWLIFRLISEDGGLEAGNRRSWFPLVRNGFSTVSMQLRVLTIPQPGRYLLQIDGLGEAQPSDAKHGLEFMRPYLLKTVACILSIILSSFLIIGGLVLFLIKLFGVE